MVRDHGHVYALGAGRDGGCEHRADRTAARNASHPGPKALAAAAALRSDLATLLTTGTSSSDCSNLTPSQQQSDTTAVLYDLSVYERAARGRNTLS